MEEFDLELEHNGKPQQVPAKLVTTGFGYKIHVTAGELEIIFERDDENKWRAVLPYGTEQHAKTDKSFIAAIGEALEKNFP
jgi:hypothetical protein